MLHNGAAGCSSVTDHLKKKKKHVLMDWNWGVSCEIKPTDVIFLKNKWLHVVCNRDYCPACCSPHLISGKQSASLLITTVIDWSAARSFQWVVSRGGRTARVDLGREKGHVARLSPQDPFQSAGKLVRGWIINREPEALVLLFARSGRDSER